MKGNILIRKSKMDINKLIEMNLNKEKWGESYVLYTYKSVTVVCVMKSFDFVENKATFEFTTSFDDGGVKRISTDTAVFRRANMTVKYFSIHLVRRILSGIRWKIRYLLLNDAENECAGLKYVLSDIGNDDVKDSIYGSSWKSILNLGVTRQKRTIKNLKKLLLEDLNEPYEKATNDYMRDNKIRSDDIYEFIKVLEEEKEKLKQDDINGG